MIEKKKCLCLKKYKLCSLKKALPFNKNKDIKWNSRGTALPKKSHCFEQIVKVLKDKPTTRTA